MSDILQRVDRKFEDDHQIRLRLSHDALLKREQHTLPRLLFDYWAECSATRLPGKAMDFNPDKILSAEAARSVSWIDTRPEWALDFVWHDHVYAWQGDLSTDYCNASGLRVRDHSVKLHREYCAVEYQFCKTTKQPVYHEIKQRTGSAQRHYTRLLLPILNAEGDVEKIVYAIRNFLLI